MEFKDRRFDITFKETRFYQDVKAEVDKDLKTEWRTRERRSLVFLLLDLKLGKLPARTKKTIAALDLTKLETLAIALLDFGTIVDLETWLAQQSES